jgi:hypothetical protein
MSDHVGTIHLREVSEALLAAWRTAAPGDLPSVAYYEFRDTVQPEVVLALLAENQRLREALERIVAECDDDTHGYEIARAVLVREEDG